jgi:hypothetical protein
MNPLNMVLRFLTALRGHPCEKCGKGPTKLVVDATRTGKRIDGKTGLVTKTFAVRSCAWLCSECR